MQAAADALDGLIVGNTAAYHSANARLYILTLDLGPSAAALWIDRGARVVGGALLGGE